MCNDVLWHSCVHTKNNSHFGQMSFNLENDWIAIGQWLFSCSTKSFYLLLCIAHIQHAV